MRAIYEVLESRSRSVLVTLSRAQGAARGIDHVSVGFEIVIHIGFKPLFGLLGVFGVINMCFEPFLRLLFVVSSKL